MKADYKNEKNKKTKKRKRKINFRRRFNSYLSKLSIIIKIITILLLLLFLFTDIFKQQKQIVTTKFNKLSVKHGFILKNIVIEGQKNVTLKEIVHSIGAKRNTPILFVDISKIKNSLNNNQWIIQSLVERRLPNTLYIAIEERTPLAIWQINQKHYLIDQEGEKIIQYKKDDSNNYEKLLLVVGADANIYANNLIKKLNTKPKFAKKIIAAIRYGGRRWDLILEKQIRIKMPEKNFNDAYDYLAKLDVKNKLFNNNIKLLDLRNKEQYFLMGNDS